MRTEESLKLVETLDATMSWKIVGVTGHQTNAVVLQEIQILQKYVDDIPDEDELTRCWNSSMSDTCVSSVTVECGSTGHIADLGVERGRTRSLRLVLMMHYWDTTTRQ